MTAPITISSTVLTRAVRSLLHEGEQLPIREEILYQAFDIAAIMDDYNSHGFTVLFKSEYAATMFLLRFS